MELIWNRHRHVLWSKDLQNRMWVDLNGRRLPELSTSVHHQLVCASLANAKEHGMAITQLIEWGFDGSAMALQRPCFEAWVRSLWLLELAGREWSEDSEKERLRQEYFDRIAKDEFPSVGRMIEMLENNEMIGQFKRDRWSHLCSYTHGGQSQLSGQLSDNGVEVRFSPDEVREALSISDCSSLVVGASFAKLLDDDCLFSKYCQWIESYDGRLSSFSGWHVHVRL